MTKYNAAGLGVFLGLILLGFLVFGVQYGKAAQKALTQTSLKSACATYNSFLDRQIKEAQASIDKTLAAKPKAAFGATLADQGKIAEAETNKRTVDVVCNLLKDAIR